MCIIYAAPKRSLIPFEKLKEGQRSNPHGIGITYTLDNKVEIIKGFESFGEFWRTFKQLPNTPCIVHMRYVSAGPRNAENCHPFRINDYSAMAHNGTLRRYTGLNNGHSDTFNFNELVLKPLTNDDPRAFDKPYIHALISDALGDNNKIAILDNRGKITIFNSHQGNYDSNGVWYSNYDYVKNNRIKKKGKK